MARLHFQRASGIEWPEMLDVHGVELTGAVGRSDEPKTAIYCTGYAGQGNSNGLLIFRQWGYLEDLRSQK